MQGLSKAASPASAAGILYQFERALLQLASAPEGSAVGLEALDDISVKSTDTGDVLSIEQDKHSVAQRGRRLGDRSEALWKTLSNWLETAAANPEVHAFLFVTNEAVRPSLLSRLGKKAKTSTDIAVLVAEIGKVSATTGLSKVVLAAIHSVQTCDRNLLAKVIARIELIDAHGDGDPMKIRSHLSSALIGARRYQL